MFYDNVVKFLKELNIEGANALPRELPSISFETEGTNVTLTDSPPGMELSANLGELIPERPEEVFSKILLGNFLGIATKHACVGLDESGKQILIQAFIPTVRSYREFRDTVEDFVNTVTFWKKELFVK